MIQGCYKDGTYVYMYFEFKPGGFLLPKKKKNLLSADLWLWDSLSFELDTIFGGRLGTGNSLHSFFSASI